MKQILKIVFSLAVLIIAGVASTFLFWNRTQQIDFTIYFPNTLNHCGESINQKDKEYVDLYNWLKTNKNGWKNTLVTFVPKNTYTSAKFSVNILDNGVIVNYQNKNGSWKQVQNEKKADELSDVCSKASELLLFP